MLADHSTSNGQPRPKYLSKMHANGGRVGGWGGVNYRIARQLIDWWIHNCLWLKLNRLLNWRSDAVNVSNWNGCNREEAVRRRYTISAISASTKQPEDYFTPITDTQNTDTLLCGFRYALPFLCPQASLWWCKKGYCVWCLWYESRTFSMEARSTALSVGQRGSTTCSAKQIQWCINLRCLMAELAIDVTEQMISYSSMSDFEIRL